MQSQSIKPTLQRIAASALAATFFVFGASAADWTVSTDTSLDADTTVDALTVESGVKLDLNGYNLTCSSIAGSGQIISTLQDLTSPDTDGTHVTWSTKDGEGKGSFNNLTTATNLFNNSTPSLEDSSRIKVRIDKLPLVVTYDFGEGSEKIVNKYSLNCYRYDSDTINSCPKAWTFEATNDTNDWTVVDSQSEVIWENGRSPRVFSFYNNTPYRYYRITITAAGATARYLVLNQLEYFHKGELHMNVPKGVTVKVPSVSSSYVDNINFITQVNGGTINLTNNFDVCYAMPSEGVMTINDGCVTNTGANHRLLVGDSGKGTLTLNGGVVDVYSVTCGNQTGANGRINLNGGTLKTRRIYTTINVMGSLVFNGGTLKASAVDTNTVELISAATTVTVDEGGGTIDSGAHDITIGAAIRGAGTMKFQGGGSITLSAASDYSGGTTIELGTKIITAYADTKDSILGNLVIDGAGLAEDTADIQVFQYSDDLTSADLAKVTLVNCGPGSAARIDGKSIVVNYVAASEWELTADATWSELVDLHGTPSDDVTVTISATEKHILTIGTDIAVAKLVFKGVNPDVVIDASAISADQLRAAESGIQIVTIEPLSGDIVWSVVNAPIAGTSARFVPDENGVTGRLRLFKPSGTILFFR